MTQLIDLGKLRFHFAGEWINSTVYEQNDVVKYGGNVYVYTYPVKTSANLPTDSTYWALMIEGFNFSGVFSANTAYQIGDGVAHGGKVYVSILDSTGQTPPNATYWSQFVDGIQYEGTYSSITAYQKNDVVVYGGVAYIAKVDTAGNDPTNTTYWNKFVDGISPKSIYNANTAYVPGDLVAYGPNIYKAKINSTGNVPTSNTHFDTFVQGTVFKGIYSSATTYYLNDLITYGSNLYRAKGTQANTVPTLSSNWELISSGFQYVGVWSSGTQYYIGQVIKYGGSLFKALSDNLNINPTTTETWEKLVPGFKNRGTWTTSTQYGIDEVVYHGGNSYISLIPHASTVFETDLIGGKWEKFNSGIRWRGQWSSNTYYLKDDIVKDAVGSAYLSTLDHTSSLDFTTDKNANNWSTFVIGGSDVLPEIPSYSHGKSLSLALDGASIDWLGATQSNNVIYVAPHGVDQQGFGNNLTSPYASIKYACQHASNGATIFVKTGTYEEQLPITVPPHVAIVGDNQRTTIVKPKTGNSDDGITPNAQSSMFLMSNGSILNKMTFVGMTGWVPGSTVADITTSTIKAVVVRLNPNSPILTKSPYVLECAAICNGAIGALIDGSVHATGAKTMIFHGYTVISDNGVGYWVKDGGKAEIVSCFTYYCYFGYAASGGGFIRALNGNNSYGTWGASSRGFDTNETAIVGAINGRQLNFVLSDGNVSVGDIITGPTGTATVRNVQSAADKVYVNNITGTFTYGQEISFSSGGVGTVASGALEDQQGFVLVVDGLSEEPRPGASIQLSGDSLSYVIQSVSGTYVNSSSLMVLVLAQEKPTGSADNATVSIRYKYSQIRLTGHDFLNIGTGGVTTTNYPGEPIQPAAQGNETSETFPGRVFYVSTDQDGNFRVGEYFRIDQATGRATLNASAFDLAGLTSLRLGSIGAQLGETINEFSSDVTLSGDSNMAIPTEHAVKTYVDTLHESTFEPTGFNRGQANTMGIIEFTHTGNTIYKIDETGNASIRIANTFATGTPYQRTANAKTLVIYPANNQSSFIVWQSGKKYVFTTMQSNTYSNFDGANYYFFNEGSLKRYGSISGDYIQKQAFVALTYGNEATANVVVFGDERHGITMDGATHYYLHTTTGTRYRSGLGVTGVSANANTYIATSSGIIYDEDIIINIPEQTTNKWIYLDGSLWKTLPESNTFAYTVGGIAKYNEQVSPGVYQLTNIPAGNYAVMYFVATNCSLHRTMRVMGQRVFTDLSAARESAQSEPRDTSLLGLPASEFLYVGAVIVDRNGSVQTLENGSVYVDLRLVNISAGTNSSSAVQGIASDIYYDTNQTGISANTNVQSGLDVLYKKTRTNKFLSYINLIA